MDALFIVTTTIFLISLHGTVLHKSVKRLKSLFVDLMRRNSFLSILIVACLCFVISCSDSDIAKNVGGMEGLIPVSTKVDVDIDDTKSSVPDTTEDPPQTDLAQEIDMVPIGRCDSLGYGDI